MNPGTTQFLRRSLITVTLVAAIVVFVILAQNRIISQEKQKRERNNLLFEVFANLTEDIERVEAGLDDIAAKTAMAKIQVGQLAASRRQYMLACALLKERKNLLILKENKNKKISGKLAPQNKEIIEV